VTESKNHNVKRKNHDKLSIFDDNEPYSHISEIPRQAPDIVESDLSRKTRITEDEWIDVLNYEKKENLSHSILLNSLRTGIPLELRPRIWGFLADIPLKIETEVNLE